MPDSSVKLSLAIVDSTIQCHTSLLLKVAADSVKLQHLHPGWKYTDLHPGQKYTTDMLLEFLLMYVMIGQSLTTSFRKLLFLIPLSVDMFANVFVVYPVLIASLFVHIMFITTMHIAISAIDDVEFSVCHYLSQNEHLLADGDVATSSYPVHDKLPGKIKKL